MARTGCQHDILAENARKKHEQYIYNTIASEGDLLSELQQQRTSTYILSDSNDKRLFADKVYWYTAVVAAAAVLEYSVWRLCSVYKYQYSVRPCVLSYNMIPGTIHDSYDVLSYDTIPTSSGFSHEFIFCLKYNRVVAVPFVTVNLAIDTSRYAPSKLRRRQVGRTSHKSSLLGSCGVEYTTRWVDTSGLQSTRNGVADLGRDGVTLN